MIASVVRRIGELHGESSRPESAPNGDRSLPPLTFEQVADWDRIKGAFSLLHDCYLEKGLISRQESGLRYTHYNLLPETGCFAAVAGDDVISTLAVIPDSKGYGLPMGQLYGSELDALSAGGCRLAEISGLAVDPKYKPITIMLMLNLVKILYRYSMKLGVTDLVLACHPKHARLYKRLFLFEEFGEEKTYASVNDAPAVALRLNLRTGRDRYEKLYGDDGFTLCRFLFSEEIFRCPAVSLRAKAFDRDVVKRLLAIQPNLTPIIESGQPGMVKRLTGEEPASSLLQRLRSGRIEMPSAMPAFVPA